MATRGQIQGNAKGEKELSLLLKRHPKCEKIFRDFDSMRGSMSDFLRSRIQPQFIEPKDWFVEELEWLVGLMQATAKTGNSIELERFAVAFGHYCRQSVAARKPDGEAEIERRLFALFERPARLADGPLWQRQGRSFSHIPKTCGEIFKAVCGQQGPVRFIDTGEVVSGGPAIDISKTQLRRMMEERGVTWIKSQPRKAATKTAKRPSKRPSTKT